MNLNNIAFASEAEPLVEIGAKNGVISVKYENKDTLLLLDSGLVLARQLINKYPDRFKGTEIIVEESVFESVRQMILGEKAVRFGYEHEKELGGDIETYFKDNYELLVQNHDAPVIKALNSIIMSAINKGSSDIHIEPQSGGYRIRLRINGLIEHLLDVERGIANSLINKIKIISGLNIAETLSPQDGQVELSISKKKINVRVSVVPMYYGEKIVLRLLMEVGKIPLIDSLGFDKEDVELLKTILGSSNGMLLVTGPTSSGKSTSLHSFIKYINNGKINITTVEDPVEYRSDEINQIPISSVFGVSFNDALRAALRQDPDVIMVGEIRDSETADIAIKASLTGHLVLTTLHTNDAISAIGRLRDMGVEEYKIKGSVLGVVAQRLVRILCKSCKSKDIHGNGIPLGCELCNKTGYSGRKLVGEVIKFNDEIREKMTTYDELNKCLEKNNFVSMRSKLGLMLRDGETSMEEITRVGIGYE